MVAVLTVFLLLALKARFAGKESLAPTVTTAGPAVAAVPATKVPEEVSKPAVPAPAGKIPMEGKKHPSVLLRDLFAPVNPADEWLVFGGDRGGDGLVLQAILMDAEAPLAIVTDQVVGVGETIGGATVESIGKNEVVLVSGKKRQTLFLNKADHHDRNK